MHFFDAGDIAELLPYDVLIEDLDGAFRQQWATPERTQHQVEVPGAAAATLLMMPAWKPGDALGVKIATVFPDNARRSLPAVHASYMLLEADSGRPIAFMDGSELTLRRTAATSALASRYLSRQDSSHLLMVGTGKLAPHMIAAHASVRDLTEVSIWGRRESAAAEVASSLSLEGVIVRPATDLERAARSADIICCATLSKDALIKGDWLRAGQHLDLVGAFNPDMREADDHAVAACDVFVDTYDGALSEAGDLLQAIDAGAFRRDDIQADLAELARGKHVGRTSLEERTLFKSVGAAIEDLVAARLALKRHSGG
jgi:ornithine cyclodeaminase